MPEEISDQEVIYNYIKGLELEIEERLEKQDDAIYKLSKKSIEKQFFGTPSSNFSWEVVWPPSSTTDWIVLFDSVTGKILKDSWKTITTILWSDDTTVPTSKAVSDAIWSSGWGDMLKSTYDTNNDWIVNSAHKEMVSFINKTGATLTKWTIVYLKSSSSSGSHPEALKANATTEAMSSKTVWAIYEDVANDATGYIVTSGEVDNLDTSAYTIGTKLWLSTTDWQVTTTAPTAPNHAVFIGTVTRSQSTNGRILYAIQNGYELEELHNVSSTAYTAIQDWDSVLVKEVSTWLWKPSLWSNIKSVLKTYLDTLYQPLSTVLTNTTASFTTTLKTTYDGYASGKLNSTFTAAQLNTAVTDNDVAFINGGNTFNGNQSFTWLWWYWVRLTPTTDWTWAIIYITNAANSNVLFEISASWVVFAKWVSSWSSINLANWTDLNTHLTWWIFDVQNASNKPSGSDSYGFVETLVWWNNNTYAVQKYYNLWWWTTPKLRIRKRDAWTRWSWVTIV